MRDQQEIENRLRGLLCQELDRRITEATKRLPHVCAHNYSHPLDHRKTIGGSPNPGYNCITSLPVAQTMGLCMLGSEGPDDWKGDICEDPIDAQRCPYFDPRQTIQDVHDNFLEDLETRTLSGEVQTLFWVLADKKVSLPWWKVFWFKHILRVNYEPLNEGISVRNLAADLLPDRDYDTVDSP